MLAAKNGAKSMLRAPVKTVVFGLILAVLAALLSVTFCVYAAVQDYLRACDAYYHTVAELEYIGAAYPDESVFDAGLADAVAENERALQSLVHAGGVIRFEPAGNGLAVPEQLHRSDSLVYDPDAAVLQVRVKFWDASSEAYTCYVTSTLYSRENYDGMLILMRTDQAEESDAQALEAGTSCVVAGRFFQGTSSYPWFQAREMTMQLGGGTHTVPAHTQLPGETVPEESEYRQLANVLEKRNSSFRVQKTACLEDFLPFQQEELVIVEGRTFTQEEYAQKANVCVISERVAGLFSAKPGDTVRLALYESNADLYQTIPAEDAGAQEYEIAGICSNGAEDPYWIYLPDAGAAQDAVFPVTGYRLGQFRLENAKAEQFYESAQALSAQGFRLSVYDQGYSAAIEPFRQLQLICRIFLGVCVLLALAVLSLQSHLFVSRQRESAQTMLALGSGRAHVYAYFLAAALLLSLPAAALGCAGGRLLERRVQLVLQQFVSQFAAQDLRYSNSMLSLTRTLLFDPVIPASVYLAAGIATVLGSAALAALFTCFALRQPTPRKQRAAQKTPRAARTSHLSGRLKYALLSIWRGRVRTAAVVGLALAAALFFGQLTGALDGYKAQLAAIEQGSVLRGYASERSGQRLDGLIVQKELVDSAAASGLLASWNVTNSIAHCRFLGVSETADGQQFGIVEPEIPESSFALETFIDRMYDEPELVQTRSVEESPMFYYTADAGMRWLEGYGESDFAAPEELQICALPETMLARYGIRLGDTVRFLYAIPLLSGTHLGTVDFKVVASYVPPADGEVIFAPFEEFKTYDSFLFTLRSAADLDALRQTLADAGFLQVRSNERLRATAVIEDKIFLSTTHSMQRQIQYVSVLYGCLYVLAGIAGAALAWLLTGSRRQEIAVMRALGTQPYRIVLNFLAEQAVLCGLGLLLGAGIWALRGGVGRLQGILTAAFFGCWCVSALCCLLCALKKQTYASLSEPE